ncbi:MAG: hypothetical protein M1814_001139 [Vezdaea aestivalis]|nr:MAG: hypothetical protein M1814_001139 [Vezdaea aestivalis]
MDLSGRPKRGSGSSTAVPHGSILRLCSAVEYGGNPNSNIGAYCAIYVDPPSVHFTAPQDSSLDNFPIFLGVFCAIKCFCENTVRASTLVEGRMVDYPNDITTLFMESRPFRHHFHPSELYPDNWRRMPIDLGGTTPVNQIRPYFNRHYVSIPPKNRIKCHMDYFRDMLNALFPRFAPLTSGLNAYQLCAASPAGGYIRGNAGGVCLPNNDGIAPGREIWFPDVFEHPFLEWGVSRWANVLKLMCFRWCWCMLEPDPVGLPSRERHIPWLADGTVDIYELDQLFDYLSMEHTVRIEDQERQCRIPTGPLIYVPCHAIWDMPIRQPKANWSDVLELRGWSQPSSSRVDLGACRRGDQDCKDVWNSSSCKGSCRAVTDQCGAECTCAARQIEKGKYQGLCFDGASTGLGRRDQVLEACPCNVTYVSQLCCGSVDGLIWEHEGLKLGVLIP